MHETNQSTRIQVFSQEQQLNSIIIIISIIISCITVVAYDSPCCIILFVKTNFVMLTRPCMLPVFLK